jgi:hypothetical protein
MSNVLRAVAVLALLLTTTAGDAFAEVRPDRDRVIANEGGIATHWKLADGANIAAPAYPAEYDNDNRPDACVALQYTIFPDGTTGDFRVVRTWKSGPVSRTEMRPFWLKFARAGVAAVGQWQFAPRDPAQVTPVTTVATLSFYGNTVSDVAELRAHCRITDLAVLVRNIERRDTLVSTDMERKYNTMNRARAALAGPH